MPWLILSFACQLLKKKHKKWRNPVGLITACDNVGNCFGHLVRFWVKHTSYNFLLFKGNSSYLCLGLTHIFHSITDFLHCGETFQFEVRDPQEAILEFKWTVTEFFLIASKIPGGTMCSNVVTIRLSNSLPNRIWILGSDKWDFN